MQVCQISWVQVAEIDSTELLLNNECYECKIRYMFTGQSRHNRSYILLEKRSIKSLCS